MNPVLQVNNLQVSYYTDAGRARALDGVDLTLNAGEKLGLVGESGSGKSTMVKLLVGLYRPDSGRILYNGISGDQVDLDQTRLDIAQHSLEAGTFPNESAADAIVAVSPERNPRKVAACDRFLDRSELLIG